VVAASEAYAGGITGRAGRAITNSYVTAYQATAGSGGVIEAAVSQPGATAYAGGIVGLAGAASPITQSYAIVSVRSTSKGSAAGTQGALAGGIAARTTAAIADSFAIADIHALAGPTGKAYAGGIVGVLASTTGCIDRTYAGGMIESFIDGAAPANSTYAGGIVGTLATTEPPVLDPPLPIPTFGKNLALQKYIDSSNYATQPHHRVIGNWNSIIQPTYDYAYVGMTAQPKYTAFPVAAPELHGTDITSVDAKDINFYKASPLVWNDTIWGAGTGSYPFPILLDLDAPTTLPSWALLP
jgi:hypothetical protein